MKFPGAKALSALALAVLGIAVFLSLPLFGRMTPRAEFTRSTSNLKQVILACSAYADDHGGNFPESLEELLPLYVDHELLLYAKDPQGNQRALIYHKGHRASDPPRTPLVEHPFLYEGKRLIGFSGGHITLEKARQPDED